MKTKLATPIILITLFGCDLGSLEGANNEGKTMKVTTPDEAAVISIVESVGALADRSEFDALGRLFADEFWLDYATLNGQPRTIKTPQGLMDEWSSVLPGFDRTRHALSNIKIETDGDTAQASARVVASHWIDDLFWQVSGHYHYEFIKDGPNWKITSMTFTVEDETGTRDVFGPAIEAAKNKPLSSNAVAERNKGTVRRFFELLEQEDMPALVGLFADDGKQINPYNGGVFPSGATGKDALMEYWAPVPENFDKMRFPISLLLATEDPSLVFVTYRGELTLRKSNGSYKNTYFSTFRFDESGKISEYVEVFDPVIAAKAFGLLDQVGQALAE